MLYSLTHELRVRCTAKFMVDDHRYLVAILMRRLVAMTFKRAWWLFQSVQATAERGKLALHRGQGP